MLSNGTRAQFMYYLMHFETSYQINVFHETFPTQGTLFWFTFAKTVGKNDIPVALISMALITELNF